MGTSAFAVPTLKELLNSPLYSVSVCTCPDCLCGRGLKLTCSEVKNFVLKNYPKTPLFWPENFKEACSLEQVKKEKPDLIVVASYGIILPEAVLKIPRWGCLNIHPSLLPKYRGPAPIQAAIFNQDKETGVTIIKLDSRMDAGDILNQKSVSLSPEITFEKLHNELSELGAKMLMETILSYCEGKIKPKKQEEEKATYTKLIKKEDGLIDWQKDSAEIDAQIRALNPWPKTYTFFLDSKKEKKRLNIIRTKTAKDSTPSNGLPPGTILKPNKNNPFSFVVTRNGQLLTEIVQPEGKKPMPANDFFRGQPNLTCFIV